MLGSIFLSAANDNFEEGFDFNENHAGDLRVDMLFVEASRNGEEGIDYEEDDDFAGGGDLVPPWTWSRRTTMAAAMPGSRFARRATAAWM